MKTIRFNNQESSVKVTIEINGIELWRYTYKADKRFDISAELKKASSHELGIAKNLEDDIHYWRIFLGNHSDVDKKVNITITWLESNNEIAKWIPCEAGPDGKVLVKANSDIEISDSSRFVKS